MNTFVEILDNDGFQDYRIYIRLLMCELKILLLPLFSRILE